VTEDASGTTTPAKGVSAAEIFLKIEQVIYFAVGLLLSATTVFALVSAAISVWGDAVSLGAPEETLISIDRLLFVLMLVEVLHTVRVSVRDGRLTAEVLYWREIPCIVYAGDSLHAELVVIDENLMRVDLTPAQRSIATKRKKEIYEGWYPETALGALGRGQTKVRQVGEPSAPRYSTDTAIKTGRSERRPSPCRASAR
jgi:hypothetical protein